MDIKDAEEAFAIVRELAGEDPKGIVDYDGPWSEVTPGIGAIKGCRFCNEEFDGPRATWFHGLSCIYVRALAWHRRQTVHD